MTHDPSRWHNKVWRYYPIYYSPEEYHKLTSWWLDKIPSLGDKIMEVGCWSALALMWLKLKFPEKDIVGIDINKAVVHFARTRAYYLFLDVPIYCEDGFDLSHFPDQSKDVIFHDGLVEHFSEEERTALLNEHLRVAKKVLFCVPTIDCYVEGKGYGDEKWETEDYWKEYAITNFEVLEFLQQEKGKIGFIIQKKVQN